MKDYKLSDIKKICKKAMLKDNPCIECEMSCDICSELFGNVFPCDWEIDTDETDKVGE